LLKKIFIIVPIFILKKIGILDKEYSITDLMKIFKRKIYGPVISADHLLDCLRNSNIKKKQYFESAAYNFPCFIGWDTARIRPDGYFAPCTSGVWQPLGNLYISNFEKMWYSNAHKEFCFKAAEILDKKNDKYFKRIGCWRACDDYPMRHKFYDEYKCISEAVKLKLKKIADKFNNENV